MRPADTNFKIAMDDLNRFMKNYELPVDQQLRLREYFQRTKHLQAQFRCTLFTPTVAHTLHPCTPCTVHPHPSTHTRAISAGLWCEQFAPEQDEPQAAGRGAVAL